MTDIPGITNDQRRLLIDTQQMWNTFIQARKRLSGYAGSMLWRKINGSEYLVKNYETERTRKQISLGPRSPDTERLFEDFQNGRAEAAERYNSLRERLRIQARLNKAIGLGRVPVTPAKILRHLASANLLGTACKVVGTHAVYAYEAVAGAVLDRGLLATEDLDLMMHAKARLRLTVEGEEPGPLLDLIRAADRTFSPDALAPYRAVNSQGYAVELIKVEPRDVFQDERTGFGLGDLEAAPIRNMRWVSNAPILETVAIAEDGSPVPMVVPDPRVFALYKLWLGTHDPLREPVKRKRDLNQGLAVADLVRQHMPHLVFDPAHLSMFPARVRDLAASYGLFDPVSISLPPAATSPIRRRDLSFDL